MKPFATSLALLAVLAAVSGQRQLNRGYGAPAPQPIQPTYNVPSGQSDRLPDSQSHDHAGLDWLLESVPGTPNVDYPIYSQDQLGGFFFDCNGQVEGGYYADPSSNCQAFHVCIPNAEYGLDSQSFLCPNGTIFNQEYLICDWWFNFDCAKANELYRRNDEIAREREAATRVASASNVRNTYSPASSPIRPVNNSPVGNSYSQPAQDSYGVQPSYGNGK